MPGRGVGSGFVYDNKGHILTNNHVVEDAEKIEVTFSDGVEIKAKVVGTDKQSDIAVIQVENTSYPPLPRGDSSKLKVGEMVMAVGSPFGFSQSVTTGIISALDRNAVGINEYESFIQTDAAINRGNSGGPLVDMNGNVIGVNSAIVSGSTGNDGIGFAIPINLATSVANMLIKDGKVHYARIGISLDPLTPELARQLGVDESTKGVVVGSVVPDSPAEKAGLKQGDVIVGFGGAKVNDASSFRLKVATSEVAKPYDIVYLRDGKEHTTKIVPAASDKVVFDQEKEAAKPAEEQGRRQGDDRRLRPRGAAADRRACQAAGRAELDQGPARDFGQRGQLGGREGHSGRRRDHQGRARPQAPADGSVKDFQELAAKSNELALYVQRGQVGHFVALSKTAK